MTDRTRKGLKGLAFVMVWSWLLLYALPHAVKVMP